MKVLAASTALVRFAASTVRASVALDEATKRMREVFKPRLCWDNEGDCVRVRGP